MSKALKISKRIIKIILSVVAGFWFIFALLSGAEEYGGGLMGIVKNSPNALPWLILGVFVFVVWKWELVGGILIALMGLFSVFAFDAFEEPFVLVAISLPLIVCGGVLIWGAVKDKKVQAEN